MELDGVNLVEASRSQGIGDHVLVKHLSRLATLDSVAMNPALLAALRCSIPDPLPCSAQCEPTFLVMYSLLAIAFFGAQLRFPFFVRPVFLRPPLVLAAFSFPAPCAMVSLLSSRGVDVTLPQ